VTLFDVALGPGATPSWPVRVTGLAVDDRAAYLLRPVVGGTPELAIIDKLSAAAVPSRLSIDDRPTEISVLPGPGRSLLALLSSGRLHIHDPVHGRITTIAFSAEARGLAVDTERRLFYVGLADEIAVLDPDAGRRLRGISVPGRPTHLICAENGTLAVLLAGERDHAVAIVEPNTPQVEVIGLPDGCQPQTLGYDHSSGLIFLAVDATAFEPAGIAVIDRDSGRRIGDVIETSQPPATLTLLRYGPRTHLFAGVPGAGVEVVDVALLAVVGRLSASWVGTSAVADQPAGELYIADINGGARRIVPLIGGGPIARRLAEVSSPDQFTPPLSGPRITPDGSTEMQKFDIGTAVASTDAGAVLVDPMHAELWLSAHGPIPGPSSAADQLGNPVGDTISAADHQVTYFERGFVLTMPLTGGPTTIAVPAMSFEANFQIDGNAGQISGDELEFLLSREP